MAKGFDCPFDCRPIIPQIKAAGIDFVERYIGVGSFSKRLTQGEAHELCAAGIDIVSVVEEWAAETEADQLRFTEAAGAQMAAAARMDAIALGQPRRTAIYFAVDGDVLASRIASNIVPFFRGIAATFAASGNEYRVGIYGSGLLGHTLLAEGLADLFQIANAHGWQGYAEYKGLAHLVQGKEGDPYGFGHGRAVDADESLGDFGSWAMGSAPEPQPRPQPAPSAFVMPLARDLQAALADIGLYKGQIDGDWGPLSQAALAAYYRTKRAT